MKLELVLVLSGLTAACASQPHHRSAVAHRHPVEPSTRQPYADGPGDADDRVATDAARRRSLDRQNANADGYVEPADRDDARADRAEAPKAGVDTPSEVAADNTAQNKDAAGEGGGLTPFDQGTSESDRKTTQGIRKAVMADDSLSFNAKNIKIITRDGYVVLRGPVNSQKERAIIQQLANQVVGADARVDNQLQVK